MILDKKRTTKALIRLRGCAGWSAPVLFATPEDRFSRDAAHFILYFCIYNTGAFPFKNNLSCVIQLLFQNTSLYNYSLNQNRPQSWNGKP